MDNALLTSTQWFGHMARVTEATGHASLPGALFDALSYLAPLQAGTVYLYPHEGLPSALFTHDDEGPWLPEGNVKRYLSGFYLLDPFYGACVEGIASGCYNLAQVAPDHFKQSQYYLAFYQHSHLEDEINYVLQLSPGLSLAVSLASTCKLSEEALARFKAISPWVLAVLARHWEGLGANDRGASLQSPWARKIHLALNNFGSSVLTERECRVAQLILRGHSTRSLAERLGVSEDTIKTHRKNVHAKLDISTQSELFSLFIDSLAEAKDVLAKDPLESYLARDR